MTPSYDRDQEILIGTFTDLSFYTVDNLQTGYSYIFKVRATNSAGQSEDSPYSDPVYTAEAPSIPQNLRLIERSSYHITIAWDLPSSTGGLPLYGYNVYRLEDNGIYSEISSAPSKTNPTVLTYTHTPVTPGTSHTFRVSAFNTLFVTINTEFESAKTMPLTITAIDNPRKPADPVDIIYIGMTSVSFEIDTVTTGSSLVVQEHIIFIREMEGKTFFYKSDRTSITINHLASDKEY
jgi:hypothetical protein